MQSKLQGILIVFVETVYLFLLLPRKLIIHKQSVTKCDI